MDAEKLFNQCFRLLLFQLLLYNCLCIPDCQLQVKHRNIRCSAHEELSCICHHNNCMEYGNTSLVQVDTSYEFNTTEIFKYGWILLKTHNESENRCLNITIPDLKVLKHNVTKKIILRIGIEKECDITNVSLQMFPLEKFAKVTVEAVGQGSLKVKLCDCGKALSPKVCNNKHREINGKFQDSFFFHNLMSKKAYCAQMILKDCIRNIPKEELEEISTERYIEVSNSYVTQAITLSVMLCISLFIMVMIVLVIFYMVPCEGLRLVPLQSTIYKRKYFSDDNFRKPYVNVLLVYSRDAPPFHRIMSALKRVLVKCRNIQVMDPLDELLPEDTMGNLNEWLTFHLNNKETKVIVVQSEVAALRQKALLCRKVLHFKEPSASDSLFIHAISQFHSNFRLNSDYSRVFPIRFEDFGIAENKLALVAPLTCFILPKHFRIIVQEICGSMSAEISESILHSQEMESLKMEIENMNTYVKRNPYYIKELFHVYSEVVNIM